MPGSSRDPEDLNPRGLFEYVKSIAKNMSIDEIVNRRTISLLYFALFNYWSAKIYAKGKRGRGPKQDSFPYSMFHQELAQYGLDREILTLYCYRVAADHYILNPTVVRLWDRPWSGKKCETGMDVHALEKVFESAEIILKVLEKGPA